MNCPNCNQELVEALGPAFCHQCGHELPAGDPAPKQLTCHNCGQGALPEAKFCHSCGNEIPQSEDVAAPSCPECAEPVLAGHKFCPDCGADLNPPAEPDEDADFSKRTACSDGMCIGIIGPDGNCRVCGKPYTGEPDLSS